MPREELADSLRPFQTCDYLILSWEEHRMIKGTCDLVPEDPDLSLNYSTFYFPVLKQVTRIFKIKLWVRRC